MDNVCPKMPKCPKCQMAKGQMQSASRKPPSAMLLPPPWLEGGEGRIEAHSKGGSRQVGCPSLPNCFLLPPLSSRHNGHVQITGRGGMICPLSQMCCPQVNLLPSFRQWGQQRGKSPCKYRKGNARHCKFPKGSKGKRQRPQCTKVVPRSSFSFLPKQQPQVQMRRAAPSPKCSRHKASLPSKSPLLQGQARQGQGVGAMPGPTKARGSVTGGGGAGSKGF